jgi:hypothetical protein
VLPRFCVISAGLQARLSSFAFHGLGSVSTIAFAKLS